MAYIVEQYVGDKGIQLANEEVIRPFSFGTNWQTLRIGVRCACNALSALSSMDVRMGLCTGNQASYGTPTDAVWLTLWRVDVSLVVTGTPPITVQTQNSSFNTPAWQRVGSTTTSFGASTLLRSTISNNPSALRSVWMVEFIKGTVGSATMTGISSIFKQANAGTGTGNGLIDTTRGDFLSWMETPGTPTTTVRLNLSTSTLPIRFTKDWDSMFVAWPRSTPTVCIYDMTVVRFA